MGEAAGAHARPLQLCLPGRPPIGLLRAPASGARHPCIPGTRSFRGACPRSTMLLHAESCCRAATALAPPAPPRLQPFPQPPQCAGRIQDVCGAAAARWRRGQRRCHRRGRGARRPSIARRRKPPGKASGSRAAGICHPWRLGQQRQRGAADPISSDQQHRRQHAGQRQHGARSRAAGALSNRQVDAGGSDASTGIIRARVSAHHGTAKCGMAALDLDGACKGCMPRLCVRSGLLRRVWAEQLPSIQPLPVTLAMCHPLPIVLLASHLSAMRATGCTRPGLSRSWQMAAR